MLPIYQNFAAHGACVIDELEGGLEVLAYIVAVGVVSGDVFEFKSVVVEIRIHWQLNGHVEHVCDAQIVE